MKKAVILFVLALTLSGCNREPIYIPVEAVFRELKPLEKGAKPSFMTESIGDTLRFRIVTENILTPAEFHSIKAYIDYRILYVKVYTTNHSGFPPPLESFGTMHEICFDLLNIKQGTYGLETEINGYKKGPTSVSHSNQ
jgi:hypothetical protein